VGQQEHLYEIFVEATEGLLVQLSEAIQKGVQEDSFLLDAFNSEYNSNAIITHFRVSSSIRGKKRYTLSFLVYSYRVFSLTWLTCFSYS